jgi:hypothetical protein
MLGLEGVARWKDYAIHLETERSGPRLPAKVTCEVATVIAPRDGVDGGSYYHEVDKRWE